MTVMWWFVFLSSICFFVVAALQIFLLNKGIEIGDGDNKVAEFTWPMLWQCIFFLCVMLLSISNLFIE